MTGSEAPPSFRLAYVPGVTPDKWVRIWNERLPDVPLALTQVTAAEADGVLLGRDADAGLVRLPVDRTALSAIPLYTETTVVLIPRDHLVTAADEVTVGDLADEIVLHPLDDVLDWERLPGRPALERPATTADAVELVAAGIGVLLVPLSLARLHHRKDLTYRTVTDAPESSVALSWPEDAHTDHVEDFIGIVRGRTVNSTRGRQPEPARSKGGKQTSAKQTSAKQTSGKQTGGARRGTGGSHRGASGGKGKGRAADRAAGRAGADPTDPDSRPRRALGDLDVHEREYRVTQRGGGEGRSGTGDHTVPLHTVQPGLEGAPGDPEEAGVLPHAGARLLQQQPQDAGVQLVDGHGGCGPLSSAIGPPMAAGIRRSLYQWLTLPAAC
ncbi:hypothetical protein STENM327S_08967 [Streptomyces tendae]